MVIFLETNIVIDYFSERSQSEISRQVMEKCVERNFSVCFSSTTVVNCFYIMRKEFSVPEIKDLFFNLFDFADIVGTSRENIIRSLENSSFSDFEDCVQSECAHEANADYIITRNARDFSASKIAALSPEEFLDKIAG